MPHMYMDDARRTHDEKLATLGAKGEHPSRRAEIRYEDAIQPCSDCSEPHKTETWMKG